MRNKMTKPTDKAAILWWELCNESKQIVVEKEYEIKTLRDALKQAALILEEDTVPSPFVKGARDRMVKTIEAIDLALRQRP